MVRAPTDGPLRLFEGAMLGMVAFVWAMALTANTSVIYGDLGISDSAGAIIGTGLLFTLLLTIHVLVQLTAIPEAKPALAIYRLANGVFAANIGYTIVAFDPAPTPETQRFRIIALGGVALLFAMDAIPRVVWRRVNDRLEPHLQPLADRFGAR
jgi:hypothetical protein